MHIVVKFAPEIGLPDLHKDVSPTQTVQNLEVLISLNYERMGECYLIYNGSPIRNRSAKLRDIFNGIREPVVTVAAKGELQAVAEQVGSLAALFNQHPFYFLGGIVALLFLVLFLLGE